MERKRPFVFLSSLMTGFLALALLQPARGMEGFRLLPPPEQDLSLSWKALESEHFRVIFPSYLDGTAERIRSEAEDVLALLGEWSGDTLERVSEAASRGRKIDIVVSDKSDEANGFVSMGPRGYFITLYAVYPYDSSATGLDSCVDWYRELLIHELAHYLHLGAVDGGVPAFYRWLFGPVVRPNASHPLFFREGFATYAETYADAAPKEGSGGEHSGRSGSGRGVSPVTDMYLRASVKDGDFLALDRASNDTSAWPDGQGHYLFGVSFLQYLAETEGEGSLHEFNRLSSRTCSYLWNRRFKEIYGKGMARAWKEWASAEEREQNARLGAIAPGGFTVLKPVSGSSGTVFSLAMDPAGRRVVYSLKPPSRSGGLYLYDRDTGGERRLDKNVFARDLAFDGDGDVVYYLRSEKRKNVCRRKNLFSFDLKKKKERRITKTGSVQGFAALDEAGTFLLCESTPGGTRIAVLAGGAIRVLVAESALLNEEGARFTVVEEPALSPGGREIAFSCRTSGGERCVYTARVDSLREGRAAFKRVTPPGARSYGPQWLDERTILYVSDEGGVFNLHKVDTSTLASERVSNTAVGLFAARVSGDSVAVKEYTSDGFRVSLLASEDGGPVTVGGPPKAEKREHDAAASPGPGDYGPRPPGGLEKGSIEPSGLPARATASEATAPEATASEASPPAAVAYKSGSILPVYWLPFAVGDGMGFSVGLSTSGGDVLGRHVYDLGVLYDFSGGDVRFRFSYLYNISTGIAPFLSASVSQKPSFYGISPDFASYLGIQATARGTYAAFRSELGVIFENPYGGPNMFLEYNSLKTALRLTGPERGVDLRQEAFLNLEGDDLLVLTETASAYTPFVGRSVLSGHVKLRWGTGGRPDPVTSGLSELYEFAPLGGVLTPGYPDPIRGEVVVNARAGFGVPLFVLERGVRTFPLFFEGLACAVRVDGGVVFSDEDGTHASRPEDERYVAPSLNALLRDPSRYVRTSLGVELKAGFLVGYDFPLDVVLGYNYAVSEGGTSGFYWLLGFDFGF